MSSLAYRRHRFPYSWGDEIGKGNANCDGCGSEWDDKQTAPVGSFEPNAFGLHDMHGNVFEWTEDCWNENYKSAPDNGKAWATGNCGRRVLRGGSWDLYPEDLRSALRNSINPDNRENDLTGDACRELVTSINRGHSQRMLRFKA